MHLINKILFIILFFVVTILSQVSAQTSSDCFSQYTCEPWGGCKDGIQSRLCKDISCNRRDIIERQFCGQDENCKPKIECSEWSECTYTEKTTDIILGAIRFGGYKTRICKDITGCVESFIEESACEESYNLQISKITECNEEFLAAYDSLSKRKLAQINLNSIKAQRFDIILTQGERAYCPACYNGLIDSGEQNLDCGGPCKSCKKEQTQLPLNLIIYTFWSSFFIFTISFILTKFTTKNKNI